MSITAFVNLFKGIAFFYKPKGVSSNDFLSGVKEKLAKNYNKEPKPVSSLIPGTSFRYPKPKISPYLPIGHGGTLDPMAEGVLPLGFGKLGCSHLSSLLKGSKKTYLVTMTLGQSTDTLDSTGRFIQQDQQSPERFCLEDFIKAGKLFIDSNYIQVPPIFSALRVNGVRSCNIARSMDPQQVSMLASPEPRLMRIHSLEWISYKSPIAMFKMTVSSGFYVRSFVRDVTEKMHTCAYMSGLVRTGHGPFEWNSSAETHLVPYNSHLEELVSSPSDQSAGYLNMGLLDELEIVQSALTAGLDRVRLYEEEKC